MIVASDLKGKGLGWQLMQHLIDYARDEGLKELFGEVLTENSTMLAMCRDLGFRVDETGGEPGIVHVVLDVARLRDH